MDRSGEVRSSEIGSGEIRSGEVGSGEVRLGDRCRVRREIRCNGSDVAVSC